jgi:glucan biosynthesis protein
MQGRFRRFSSFALAAFAAASLYTSAALGFGFDDVAKLAERQAKKPYQAPAPLPPELANLT